MINKLLNAGTSDLISILKSWFQNRGIFKEILIAKGKYFNAYKMFLLYQGLGVVLSLFIISHLLVQ